MIFDDAVALAGPAFESGQVEDADRFAAVLDKPFLLEDAGRQRDGWAGGAKHVGEELMGQAKGVAACAICADEQPTSQTLFDIVFCVAARGLGCLDELRLNITQGEGLKVLTEEELFSRGFDWTGIA